MSIRAMQAGKHVYVEKPVSHNVWEGRLDADLIIKVRSIFRNSGERILITARINMSRPEISRSFSVQVSMIPS